MTLLYTFKGLNRNVMLVVIILDSTPDVAVVGEIDPHFQESRITYQCFFKKSVM